MPTDKKKPDPHYPSGAPGTPKGTRALWKLADKLRARRRVQKTDP